MMDAYQSLVSASRRELKTKKPRSGDHQERGFVGLSKGRVVTRLRSPGRKYLSQWSSADRLRAY